MGLGSMTLKGSAVVPGKCPGRDTFFPGERKKEDSSQYLCASVARLSREQNPKVSSVPPYPTQLQDPGSS